MELSFFLPFCFASDDEFALFAKIIYQFRILSETLFSVILWPFMRKEGNGKFNAHTQKELLKGKSKIKEKRRREKAEGGRDEFVCPSES